MFCLHLPVSRRRFRITRCKIRDEIGGENQGGAEEGEGEEEPEEGDSRRRRGREKGELLDGHEELLDR